jgi:NAD(P)-dependent dehydrogenase (short-subunit alcohol dehydrogenase family)
MELQGRVVVVTGGGSGIGAATCLAMAEAHATVIVADIDRDAARATASEAASLGAQAAAIEVNVADVAAASDMISAVVSEHRRIDVLVNNAGVSRQADILDVTPEDWDYIFSVNARGVFFCLQAAAREMIKQGGGRIINMSSISGRGYPKISNIAYGASKAAVIGLTKTAAQQLGPFNINVNAVCPGITQTPLVRMLMEARASERGLRYDEVLGESASEVPIGRMNDPSDVANLVVFLASDRARNITAQAYNIDGGLVPS